MDLLFKVVQKIDENSTRTVYRAVRKENQEKVILKVFNKLSMTPELLSFLSDDKTGIDVAVPSEFVHLKKLQHIHNCVRMIEFINDEENDKWIIVLEDLEAHGYENLARQLSHSHRVLDERTVAWILRELILTVMEIHKCNIVHCDLKPDNIFFDRRNLRLKLIDFNLASEIKHTNKRVSPPGCTPDYAPPEVLIKRQPWTPAAEVWSIGCTAFVLLCRRFPFENPWMCDSCIPNYPESTHRSEVNIHKSLYYSSSSHERFKSRTSQIDSNSVVLSNRAKDFLLICLCRSPHRRASTDALLKHPFLAKMNHMHDEHPASVPPTSSRTVMVS